MENILLHDPMVRFYLLYVAGLFVALLWDSLCNRPTIQDGSRIPQNEMAHGTPGQFPLRCQPAPSSVGAETGQQTVKEVMPVCGSCRLQAPTNPTLAPNSTNRREYHVVTS
jgi:hypothetical protein